jgi:signal transduction histidine kinase
MAQVRALLKKTNPKKTQLDIHSVIEDVITIVQSEVGRHGVSLRFELAPILPPVIADRVQLQQVLLNLILNGIEAMSTTEERRRVLRIRTHDYEAGEILVAIDDTGIGVSPREMDRIFAAFFTSKPDGSGMGLSISRSIVEAHGGKLWAISGPGHGATFQFTLPIALPLRPPREDA